MQSLDGFAFYGYRSYSSAVPTRLWPLSKINLIAGQNNAGKSNILRVLASTYGASQAIASPWDRPLGEAEHKYVRLQHFSLDSLLNWSLTSPWPNYRKAQLLRILDHPALTGMSAEQAEPGIWIPVTEGGQVDQDELSRISRSVGDSHDAQMLSLDLTSSGGGSLGQDVLRILNKLLASRPRARTAYSISGVRAISEASDNDPDLNGLSIKRRLLELQNPDTDRLDDKKLFLAVQDFVRAVLDDQSITIDIPHTLSTIHVTQAGQTLPIENLGTGVHEVVIIAAAATIIRDAIMCIEEPEVHLHPILQRKLLAYLNSNTTNQYFIATHSAHMLDSNIGAIFHVTRRDGLSAVSYAGNANARAAICADLGYRPSDLVQTNAVLWVEGPSDRIYLKYWIDAEAPGAFVEGTHYSIMFYGGSLLSALSPLDADEVDEFISLRRLNRNMLVLIDSDRSDASAPLNASKTRVVNDLEADDSHSFAWVTAGYTIENYVPESTLSNAIGTAHPSVDSGTFAAQRDWENPLSATRVGLQQPSKVAIARCATTTPPTEWPLDLLSMVRKTINFIRVSNIQN